MKYLYLAASLPTLILEDPAPESPEEFLFRCTGALDADDLEELKALLEGEPERCSSRAARRWFDLDTQLRNAVAENRAKRRGVDSRGFAKPHHQFDTWTQEYVTEAFAKSTPFAREEILDQTRWRWLEDLATEDPYGFSAIAAHGLKLQLAARWDNFDDDRGREGLDQHLNTLLETASTET